METDGVGAHARRRPAQLVPGESITLLPGVWHGFWGEGKDVLIGEVSTVNDDLTDNVFAEPIGRFAEIEEDARRSTSWSPTTTSSSARRRYPGRENRGCAAPGRQRGRTSAGHATT